MAFTKLLGVVAGATLAIGITTAVVIAQTGNEPAPKRPAASVTNAPSNDGTDQASTASTSPAVAAPAATPAASPATTTKPAAATAAPAASSASAPAAPSSKATAQEVVNSVTALTEQLQQAANNGGQPRPLTQEEVNAALQEQLAKLGIKL